MSTEEFGCLLMYLLESGGKFELLIKSKHCPKTENSWCTIHVRTINLSSFFGLIGKTLNQSQSK